MGRAVKLGAAETLTPRSDFLSGALCVQRVSVGKSGDFFHRDAMDPEKRIPVRRVILCAGDSLTLQGEELPDPGGVVRIAAV